MRAQALFCQVTTRHVLNMFDVSNIWHVPIMLEAQGAHQSICTILGLGGHASMNLSGAHPLPALQTYRCLPACSVPPETVWHLHFHASHSVTGHSRGVNDKFSNGLAVRASRGQ